ncbi:MAG: DNA-processing protein DprA [Eubacteriales bacterium]|nr:DNA-processing protein DprA [Eubacteriales bacterium]
MTDMMNMNRKKDIMRIGSCDWNDSCYPKALKEIKDSPKKLYFIGNIEIINQTPNIAVIGSRKISEQGIILSRKTGEMVARQGYNLVNGLALGCDAEAMKGALYAGGKCIAILPSGLEQIQPRSNEPLAREIVESGGCLLSEYPEGTPVRKYQYVARDRLQSGISQGVCVIETTAQGGTMHTADFAMKQNKRLACYYSGLLKNASGNEALAKKEEVTLIKKLEEFSEFIQSVGSEPSYHQITLDHWLEE